MKGSGCSPLFTSLCSERSPINGLDFNLVGKVCGHPWQHFCWVSIFFLSSSFITLIKRQRSPRSYIFFLISQSSFTKHFHFPGQDINMTFTSMINRSSFGTWALLKVHLLIYLIKEKPKIKWQRPVTGELGGETTSGFSQLWGPVRPSEARPTIGVWQWCGEKDVGEGQVHRVQHQQQQDGTRGRERSASGHKLMPRNPQIKFNYNYHVLLSLLSLSQARSARLWSKVMKFTFLHFIHLCSIQVICHCKDNVSQKGFPRTLLCIYMLYAYVLHMLNISLWSPQQMLTV